mgnify:FL=1
MTVRPAIESGAFRIRILLVLMLVLCALLGVMLWKIQVAHGHDYVQDLDRQSVRRIRLPAMRGTIVDRSGAALVENEPSYAVAVYIEELRQPGVNVVDAAEALIRRLGELLQLPVDVTRDDIANHYRKRLPLPFIVWKNLSEETLARWAELAAGIPGADIYWEGLRHYPHGQTASHVLGYVGRASLTGREEEPYHYYLPEWEGKSGIEQSMDDVLRGRAGGKLIRVDVAGYKHADLGGLDPEAGSDLMLTLDLHIQKLAEEALEGHNGAMVVMDPRNGEVLAMASAPAFDPNNFVPAISHELWAGLRENPAKPMVNRAVAGNYPPGSIFKPVVAMAALESGKIRPGQRFNCPGYMMLGKARFNCWHKPGHGEIELRKAIEQSCNVYFYDLGLMCGHEPIVHMAYALGLGRKTGVEMSYERAGLVPDDSWKRRTFSDGWRDGDTCNMSIGQGALLVSPLQMAVVASALANGGFVYAPHLVRGVRRNGDEKYRPVQPRLVNDLHWSSDALRTVRGGMFDVVMAPTGTGRKAGVPGIEVAGKTGTAEYGPKGSGLKYGWMIAFAPYENPRYAVAVVVEEAYSGGVTAAPLVSRLLGGIFRPAAGEGGAG